MIKLGFYNEGAECADCDEWEGGSNGDMIGYKAFEKNLSCRGFQYEIGKTYEMDDGIVLCESGFHFCRYPAQVFEHYDKESRICEVEADGKIIEGDNKCVCNKITILREIAGGERGRIFYDNGNGNGDGHSNGNGFGPVW